jgi:hypothetical protein
MIADLIRLLLASVSVLQAESAARSARGQDLDWPDDDDLTGVLAHSACEDDLRTTLMPFDRETLLKVETLYYYGRDRDLTFREKLEYLRRSDEPKEWIVSNLLGKWPAWEMCFAHAQARLRKEGLSLETV